jgi:hypothetical protein
MTLPEEAAHFGIAGWPCLSPVCDHKKQPVIQKFTTKLRYKDQRLKGVFECPLCGFTYSRVGPDQSQDNRFTYTKLEATGPVWEEEFRKWWHNPLKSLDEIGNHFDIDPKTGSSMALKRGYPSKSIVNEADRRVTQKPNG